VEAFFFAPTWPKLKFMPYSDVRALPISLWKECDRPREKLLHQGASSLNEAELLAILIGSGMRGKSAVQLAQSVLDLARNDLNELAKLKPHFITQVKGIGEAKAIQIAAAVELGRRRDSVDITKKPAIRSSKDAFAILHADLRDLSHEEFWVLTLNRANRVMNKVMVSKGGLAGTVADAKIIFQEALLGRAAAIIIAHNHPSGNLNPSQADREITKKLKNAGDFLDLPVLDHLIISEGGYFSFADEGLI
jgi:DNA repair protein RadC